MEYPIEEAITMLSTNLESAKKSVETLENDLRQVKDKIVTTEVNIARVFNYDVKTHRKTDVAEKP